MESNTGNVNRTSTFIECVSDEAKTKLVLGFFIVIIISGIVGNSITCVVFKFRMKPTTGNILILWLAILDLFNCVTDIPYNIHLQIVPCSDYIPVVCKGMHYVLYATMFASVFTLALIAIDKFYKICKPLRLFPFSSPRKLILTSIGTGATLAMPVVFLYGPSSKDTGRPTGCSLDDSPLKTESILHLFYFILSTSIIFVAFVYILILYTLIGLKARIIGRSRSFKSSSEPTLYPEHTLYRVKRQTISARDFTELGKSFVRGRSNSPYYRQKRTTVICVTMTVAFLLCFFPTFILTTLKGTVDDKMISSSPVGKMFYHIFVRSYYLTNAVNPVIYGFLNPVFRSKCLRLLKDTILGQMCKRKNRSKVQIPHNESIKCSPPIHTFVISQPLSFEANVSGRRMLQKNTEETGV